MRSLVKIMSRIGKMPIEIKEGVEIKLEGQRVFIKGEKGSLSFELPEILKIKKEGRKLIIFPKLKDLKGKNKKVKALWGLWRSLLKNAIKGVKEGFEKKLEVVGIGYQAKIEGKELVLKVGFSHPVRLKIPDGLNLTVEKNIISVSGIDKQKVGDFCAKIRKIRPPDPYKGKGIRYFGEKVRKKEGKKAVGTINP